MLDGRLWGFLPLLARALFSGGFVLNEESSGLSGADDPRGLAVVKGRGEPVCEDEWAGGVRGGTIAGGDPLWRRGDWPKDWLRGEYLGGKDSSGRRRELRWPCETCPWRPYDG